MNAYQITILVLYALNLFISAAMDGKEKEGKVSFPITFMSVVIWLWVLCQAGTFNTT